MICDKDKRFLLWFRNTQLGLAQYSLRAYKRTSNQEMLRLAKWFGENSADIKRQLSTRQITS